MDTYRASRKVEATRIVEEMGMGLAVGIKYQTEESYSPTLYADSSISEQDAVNKLNVAVDGYCSIKGTQTCVRTGKVEVEKVGSFKLFVENVMDSIFGWHASNM